MKNIERDYRAKPASPSYLWAVVPVLDSRCTSFGLGNTDELKEDKKSYEKKEEKKLRVNGTWPRRSSAVACVGEL